MLYLVAWVDDWGVHGAVTQYPVATVHLLRSMGKLVTGVTGRKS